MRTYIAYKRVNGVKEYLTEDNTFTRDRTRAKEFNVKFWIEVLKIIIQILSLFGVSVKLKKI